MKRIALFCSILFLSCGNKKASTHTEEPVFDSSLVRPLSDSVASLYRHNIY